MYINLQNSFRPTHTTPWQRDVLASGEPPALRRTRGINQSHSHSSHASSPQCYSQRTPAASSSTWLLELSYPNFLLSVLRLSLRPLNRYCVRLFCVFPCFYFLVVLARFSVQVTDWKIHVSDRTYNVLMGTLITMDYYRKKSIEILQ